MKNGKKPYQNTVPHFPHIGWGYVPQSRKQNLAAAKECETFNLAVGFFRALQHANNMGTGEDDFNELEQHFINKQGLMDYIKRGFSVSSASDQEAGIIPKKF